MEVTIIQLTLMLLSWVDVLGPLSKISLIPLISKL